MVIIESVRNPTLNEYGQVSCEVKLKVGDGVGAQFEWVPYNAVRGDVAASGNQVWAMLCAGDFTCDDNHALNFDPSQLTPDSDRSTS